MKLLNCTIDNYLEVVLPPSCWQPLFCKGFSKAFSWRWQLDGGSRWASAPTLWLSRCAKHAGSDTTITTSIKVLLIFFTSVTSGLCVCACVSHDSALFICPSLAVSTTASCLVSFCYPMLENDMVACVTSDDLAFLTLLMIDPGARETKSLKGLCGEAEWTMSGPPHATLADLKKGKKSS